MTEHLPVPIDEPPRDDEPTAAPRQRIAVAFLPLALIAFTIISLVAAAWTFLAATGA
jgi:hypothetical protein